LLFKWLQYPQKGVRSTTTTNTSLTHRSQFKLIILIIMSGTTSINGYVEPNFPHPMGPHDAMIIIYGYVVRAIFSSVRRNSDQTQIYPIARPRCSCNHFICHCIRIAFVASASLPNLVLQHHSCRYIHGNCWIHLSPSVQPARSVFRRLVCRTGKQSKSI
jgi:hypothetical protein